MNKKRSIKLPDLQKLKKIVLLTSIISTVVFLVLLFWIKTVGVPNFDIVISRALVSLENPIVTLFMRMISMLGYVPVGITTVIIVAWLLYRRNHRLAAKYIFFVLAADLFSFLLRVMISRPRPKGEFFPVMEQLAQPAFPSGHVVHYVVLFGFIALLARYHVVITQHWKYYFITGFSILLFLSIGLSRIYFGAHWATDVLAGYAVGIFLLSIQFYSYVKRAHQEIDKA